jgi:hypothetical protein
MEEYFTKTQQPYSSLLQRVEWLIRRDQILRRYGAYCHNCGKLGVDYQIHHKYYVTGLDPWEYQDDALVAYCPECHRTIHKQLLNNLDYVPVYRLNKYSGLLEKTFRQPCLRCEGAGYFQEYRHIQNGVCFRCNGQRFEAGIIRSQLCSIQEYERVSKRVSFEVDSLFKGIDEFPVKITSVVARHDSFNDSFYAMYANEDGLMRPALLDNSNRYSDYAKLDLSKLEFYVMYDKRALFRLKQ